VARITLRDFHGRARTWCAGSHPGMHRIRRLSPGSTSGIRVARCGLRTSETCPETGNGTGLAHPLSSCHCWDPLTARGQFRALSRSRGRGTPALRPKDAKHRKKSLEFRGVVGEAPEPVRVSKPTEIEGTPGWRFAALRVKDRSRSTIYRLSAPQRGVRTIIAWGRQDRWAGQIRTSPKWKVGRPTIRGRVKLLTETRSVTARDLMQRFLPRV
jgi:hypothetical protein